MDSLKFNYEYEFEEKEKKPYLKKFKEFSFKQIPKNINYKIGMEENKLSYIPKSLKLIEGSIDLNDKKIVIFFVGGCTYSEIHKLKSLFEKLSIELIIVTSNIINSNDLINGLIHQI